MSGSSVASTAASIGTSAGVVVNGRTARKSLIVQNLHATQLLYLGGSDVSTSNGLQVAAAGGTRQIDNFTGTLYGIASGASTDVRVIEIS